MTLCVDVNVLLHAAFEVSPHHAQSASLLREWRKSGEVVLVPSAVALGFVRLATGRRLYAEPMTDEGALAFIDVLLGSRTVELVEPGSRHWVLFSDLVGQHGLRGAEVTDAYLAAIAIERGATWVSYDRGFARFSGLSWVNPAESDLTG